MVIAQFTIEAVGADHDPITFLDGKQPEIGLGLIAGAQGTGHYVAAGMNGCLLRGDVPGIHQFLHLGVVHAHLRELPLAEAVRPGISDVHHQPIGQAHLFHHHDAGQRGSGTGSRGVADGCVSP
ncbi:hypothetical protein D9M72_639830 [compost metagenome]